MNKPSKQAGDDRNEKYAQDRDKAFKYYQDHKNLQSSTLLSNMLPTDNPTQGGDELDNALEMLWRGGLDFATSDDFKKLSPEDRDKVHLIYKTKLKKEALQLIQEHTAQARLDEARQFNRQILNCRNEYELIDWTADRIAELRSIRDYLLSESKLVVGNVLPN